VRGIVRPCRTHLGPELGERWQAHLCGLCLTLGEVAGQPERALTGYDVLLLSVLVEAQAGRVGAEVAGPCALRGFRSATVVASDAPAAQLAAAGALLSGGAGLTDKLLDGDLPRVARTPAARIARRLVERGSAVAARVGRDPTYVLAAPRAATAAEARPAEGLLAILTPAGEAVASLFASTAQVAGRPQNVGALTACGRAFGRLVHLLDAVEDREADQRAGRFNALTATRTTNGAAQQLAERLRTEVAQALSHVDMVDRALVDVLLGRELTRAVHRVFPQPPSEGACATALPHQRNPSLLSGLATTLVSVLALLLPGVFVGGSWGGGGCRPRRRGFGGYPPEYGPDYGYGRRRFRRGYGPPVGYGYRSGPSCGQLLACNCCANVACNACCCDGCGDV
jgi:hypothetical protein